MKEFGRAAKFVKVGVSAMTQLKLGGCGVQDALRRLNAAMDRVMKLGKAVVSDDERWAAADELLRMEASCLKKIDFGWIDFKTESRLYSAFPRGLEDQDTDEITEEMLDELELGGTMVEESGNDIAPIDYQNRHANAELSRLCEIRPDDVALVTAFINQNERQSLGAGTVFDGPSGPEFNFQRQDGFTFGSWSQATSHIWKGKNQ